MQTLSQYQHATGEQMPIAIPAFEPFTLVLGASGLVGDDGLTGALIVTQDFLRRIVSLNALMSANGLSSVSQPFNITWSNPSITGCEMIVLPENDVIWRAHPRGGEYDVETGLVSVDELVYALMNRGALTSPQSSTHWVDGVLFACLVGSMQDMAARWFALGVVPAGAPLPDGPLYLPETLDWLTQLRSGHHGGAGR